MANGFFWYELMTTDPAAGVRFYADVVGWRPEPFPGMPYTVMNAADRGIAGVMELPEPVRAAGGVPGWIGTVKVADVDAATAALRTAGGTVQREPADIPEVGRFSVVADPQGAVFQLMAPNGPEQPGTAPMTPGHCGWRELHAADWEKAWDFYSGLFGWTKDTAVDMGPMGTYQTFGSGDAGEGGDGAVGGMMTMMPGTPRPAWGFYFVVDGIDAAAERVKTAGGRIMMGPHQVPGGGWIVNGRDPQGAIFALVSATK